MNIGIDGNVFAGHRTGIGVYSQNLVNELDKALPRARFYVYTRQSVHYELPSDRWTHRLEPNPRWARMKYQLWLRARCHQLYRPDNLQVFWGAGNFLPRLLPGVRGLVTLYDLTYRLAPETMARGTYWQHRLWMPGDLRRADRVISISNGTAQRAQQLLGIETHGVEHPRLLDAYLNDAEPGPLPEGVAADRPYFLAVGSQEPRKQLQMLLQAYVALRELWSLDATQPLPRLVLAGGPGWRNNELLTYIEQHRADDILSLGFVSTEMLRSLYSNAAAFIFPSAYEGFGIPVREALLMGARVFTTDIPELREAGGQYAGYFKATPEALTALMHHIALGPKPKPSRPQLVFNDRHEFIGQLLQLLHSSQ